MNDIYDDLKVLAKCFCGLMEGDVWNIEVAYEIMEKHQFIDKDGVWIEEE